MSENRTTRRSWWEPPTLRVSEGLEEHRHATWLELFYDLIFVVAVAELGQNLLHDVTWLGFLEFVGLFIPVWWSWVGFAFYATRFDTDDTGHRLLAVVQILAVGALAVNTRGAVGPSSAGFALSYAAIRFVLVLEYLRAYRHVPRARRFIKRFGTGFAVAASIWLISAFVPIPWRFLMWGMGLLVDFGTPLTAGQLHAQLPPHTSHLPERFGTFTIIVLGEAVAGVVRGVERQNWNILSGTTAAFGLALAFSLWWVYFEKVGGTAIRAAVNAGRVWTYQGWLYAHLLLAIGITAVGVGIEEVVTRAQMTALPAADRWLLCGAAVISLLALGMIHFTTVSETARIRLLQEPATVYRLASAAFVLLVAWLGGILVPVALTAVLALICASQVVLDFYEAERHATDG